MAIITVFHLDNSRPLAFGQPRKSKILWTSKLNEDIIEAERYRSIQILINEGRWPAFREEPKKYAGRHSDESDKKLILKPGQSSSSTQLRRKYRLKKKNKLQERLQCPGPRAT